MATIYPTQQQQFGQQPAAQEPLFSTQQAKPQNLSQDPLFEALARYITSSSAPSAITASGLEEIINLHINEEGGRAYLESIVAPSPDDLRIWKSKREVKGSVDANMSRLALAFELKALPNSLERMSFGGRCPGFFGLAFHQFGYDKATLWYDDLVFDGTVKIEVRFDIRNSRLRVKFSGNSEKAFAELIVEGVSINLPPVARGEGRFTRVM